MSVLSHDDLKNHSKAATMQKVTMICLFSAMNNLHKIVKLAKKPSLIGMGVLY